MKIITFDFDNTIAMSYMDTTGEEAFPIFQHYNDNIVEKIKKNIELGNELYIVTSRSEELEGHFPDQTIPFHLNKLGLDEYFLPDRVFYTNNRPKYPTLLKLKTSKHYDDDIHEHHDGIDSEYEVKQPLDELEDSDIVGKVVIFDDSGNVLVLQRSDTGNLWDLPGGHIKNIEVGRVSNGLKDGTEREVYEETGLFMPFLKHFMKYDFNHKGIVHEINLYLSKIDKRTPHVMLDLQDHIENIDYRWVPFKNLEGFTPRSTTNLRKAFDELSVQGEIFEQNEPYQLKMKKKHRNMKRRLIGYGKNKSFGGGKGHSRPKMTRSKSAPPIGEAKMPENDEKPKKKVKIKVKFIKNIDEKRKKRKKKKKKARKSRKKRPKFAYSGGYFPYYDMYDGGGSGDSGGDGGGGGE